MKFQSISSDCRRSEAPLTTALSELKPAAPGLVGAAEPDAKFAKSIISSLSAGTLTKEQWARAVGCAEVLEWVFESNEEQLSKYAAMLSGRGRRGFDNALSDIRFAALSALEEYDPQQQSLGKFLKNRLQFRVIDLWRSQGRNRGQYRRVKDLERKANEIYLSEGYRVALEDSRILDSLGLEPKNVREAIQMQRVKAPLPLTRTSHEGTNFDFDVGSEDSTAILRCEAQQLLGMLCPLPRKLLSLRFLQSWELKAIGYVCNRSDAWASQEIRNILSSVRECINAEVPLSSQYIEGKPLGMAFLERELEVDPSYVLRWESVPEYLGVLPELLALRSSRRRPLVRAREQVLDSVDLARPSELSAEARVSLSELCRGTFSDVDRFAHASLAQRVFGADGPKSSSDWAAWLVSEGMLSGERPWFHPGTLGKRFSRYFDPRIVGHDRARDNRRSYLKERIRGWEDASTVAISKSLAACLRLKNSPSRDEFLKALVREGVLSPQADSSVIARRAGIRPRFLSAEVVSPEARKANLAAYYAKNFGSLDRIPQQDSFLASELGCANTKHGMAHALVVAGAASAEVPEGTLLSVAGGHLSLYFDSSVVDEAQCRENIHRFITYSFRDLDDFRRDGEAVQTLPGLLGIKNSVGALAKYAVDCRLVSGELAAKPRLAHGHSQGVSFYLRQDVVGDVLSRTNLITVCRDLFRSLNDVSVFPSLAAELGIESTNEAFATYLVNNSILDWRIPEGAPLVRGEGMRSQAISFYVRPEVVGFEAARANLKSWVERSFPDLHAVKPSRTLARALALTARSPEDRPVSVPGSKAEYAAELVRRGWLSSVPTDGFRCPPGNKGNLYLDPAVVGEERSRSNFIFF